MDLLPYMPPGWAKNRILNAANVSMCNHNLQSCHSAAGQHVADERSSPHPDCSESRLARPPFPVIKMMMRALFSSGILTEKSKEVLSNNNEEKLGAPDWAVLHIMTLQFSLINWKPVFINVYSPLHFLFFYLSLIPSPSQTLCFLFDK